MPNSASPTTRPSSGLRVLVVDDVPELAAMLREVLRDWGHEVAVAHNGRMGLEKAQALRPDLIVTDIEMPEMNGWEMATALRRLGELGHTVLVALSGTFFNDGLSQASPFDHQFRKPMPFDRLRAIISEIVARRASATPEAAL